MPPAKNSSNILSNEEDSEPTSFTKGAASARSGNKGVLNLPVRACAQSRLPRIVFISPLCAKYLNG